MQEDKIAHFDIVREQNRKIIRNLLRKTHDTGKSELAALSGLSFPTVSNAIKDLVNSGEVKETYGGSNGGRPGAVFNLNGEYQYFICSYLSGYELTMRVFDACGKLCEDMKRVISADIDPIQLMHIFEEIKDKYPKLTAISFGIPGVILNGVIKHLPYLPALEEYEIEKDFQDKLNLRMFAENDINVIVLAEKYQYKDLAHIILSNGCIGTGIIFNGQIIRGAHGSAGELEYICDESKDSLEVITQGIVAISCVIDIADIAVSGIEEEETTLSLLKNKLQKRLPSNRIPEIHFIKNTEELYYQGLYQMVMEYYGNL